MNVLWMSDWNILLSNAEPIHLREDPASPFSKVISVQTRTTLIRMENFKKKNLKLQDFKDSLWAYLASLYK